MVLFPAYCHRFYGGVWIKTFGRTVLLQYVEYILGDCIKLAQDSLNLALPKWQMHFLTACICSFNIFSDQWGTHGLKAENTEYWMENPSHKARFASCHWDKTLSLSVWVSEVFCGFTFILFKPAKANLLYILLLRVFYYPTAKSQYQRQFHLLLFHSYINKWSWSRFFSMSGGLWQAACTPWCGRKEHAVYKIQNWKNPDHWGR